MIKRILVALDLDSDTPVATRYAVEIAERFNSFITGLAVVDMGSIEASAKGGGIGSMYYAEKVKENLTAEAREKALKLIKEFRSTLENTSVEHMEVVEEGVPFRRIIEDTKFNDILIVGQNPHFFYSHPEKHTHTLARIIEKSIGPTLFVPKKHRPVKRVLIASDGTNESSRAIQLFVHLEPFGKEIIVRIMNVGKKESTDDKLLLQMSKSYMQAHGFDVDTKHVIHSSPKESIIEESEMFEADLIVMGGHTRRTLRSEKLGETTAYVMKESSVPILMDH